MSRSQAAQAFPLPQIRPDLQRLGKYATTKGGYVAGQVEVTSRCFQSCIGCDSWREDLAGVVRGEWSLEQLCDFVRDLGQMPEFQHLSLTGGDPQAWEPLSEFLRWTLEYNQRRVQADRHPITFQLNTALVKSPSPEERALWREAVADIRVSLDGLSPETYTKIRGSKHPTGEFRTAKDGSLIPIYAEGNATNPRDILARMRLLHHSGLSTNTTVFFENVHEVVAILDALDREVAMDGMPFRKAMFLAVVGDRGGNLGEYGFWESWAEIREFASRLSIETSFSENPKDVRDFLASGAGDAIPCYAGNVSFHAKANGDLYPCCLAGGEALKTQQHMALGNLWEEPVEKLYDRYTPTCDYANPVNPCTSICQWKQLQVNLAGHLASLDKFTMP